MGFVSMSVLFKAFVALQLLVSVNSQAGYGSQAEWVKKPPVVAPVAAPVKAPVVAPVKAPVKAPVVAPVKAPVKAPVVAPVKAPKPSPPLRSPVYLPNRKPIAVQGVVYCKSCKYPGSDTLNGASPLSGAGVKLKCNNGKRPIIKDATTDKNGYFFIQPPKQISSFGVHKCRVVLASSPLASCKNATNLNGGLLGAILRFERPTKPIPFALYTVGPLAFGPTKCY